MSHHRHNIFLLFFLAVFSAHHEQEVTAAFLNSARGGTTATATNNAQIKTQPSSSIIATAADAALALNSIDFMNLLSRRKNTADVRTFTQPITIDNDDDVRASVHRKNSSSNDESCREKQQLSRLHDDEHDTQLPLWPLLNVFFRNNKQQQQHSCIQKQHHSSQTTKTKKTAYKTVTEYKGILWFLPQKHCSTSIQFRETIRIISLVGTKRSTIECLTEYYNGKRGEWVDCSRILCHFTSLNDGDDDEEDDATTTTATTATTTTRDDTSMTRQSKVKMTLDTELLVWLPLPSMASRAVQKKIGSVFEEIVVEFLFGS